MPKIIILPGGGWNEFDERYKDASVEELVRAFNRDVGNRGWVSARGRFHIALAEAFLRTGLDCSSFIETDEQGGPTSMSLDRHIRLEGARLIQAETTTAP